MGSTFLTLPLFCKSLSCLLAGACKQNIGEFLNPHLYAQGVVDVLGRPLVLNLMLQRFDRHDSLDVHERFELDTASLVFS